MSVIISGRARNVLSRDPNLSEPSSSSLESMTDQAALWYAQLDSGTADERAFETWRAADPRHAAAFARIAATGEILSTLSGTVEVPAEAKQSRVLPSRRYLLQGGVLAAVLIAGIGIWLQSHSRVYAETLVGGRQSVPLPDGDRLDLNTDTKVGWRFTGKKKEVWVERGEIALHVASGQLPVLVHASGKTFLVTSGDVNLRTRDRTVNLVVVSGSAQLRTPETSIATIIPLTAGQTWSDFAGEPRHQTLSEAGIRSATAWQRDEFIATGQRLDVVLADYNRYIADKIVVDDPALAALHVGGRFSTRDPKAFVAALETTFSLNASTGPDGTVHLTR
jgi:transmembrane sensor